MSDNITTHIGLVLTPEDTNETFKSWRAKINGEQNSNMTKIDDKFVEIDEGKVDLNGGDISDTVSEFTEATTRDNISTGEKTATIFGKIMKWFSDLKAVAFSNSYNDLDNKPTSLKNPNALTVTLNGSSSTYDGSSAVSKSFYAPTTYGTSGYTAMANGSGAVPTWAPLMGSATCSTSAATTAKTASITNFKLIIGARVRITFTYTHTSSSAATLNISSTGAKTIYLNNSTVTSSNTWRAGDTVEFSYDGTYWRAAVDNRLSDTSTNAVQNKVIKSAIDELDVYLSDIQNENLAPPTTITIACVDSKHNGFADYCFTGSNGTQIFQNAIDALPSTGGKIVVLEGEYTITGKLTCNKDVIFEGMGDGTIINCSASSLAQIGTSGYCNVMFRNMSIKSSTITSGTFNCGGYLMNLYLDDIAFDDFTIENQGGIVRGYSSSSTRVHLHNVRIDATISNSSGCASLFYNCSIDGGDGCDIYSDVLYNSYGAEVFYTCTGKFSGGKLDCDYILGCDESISISNCYISCISVNKNDKVDGNPGNGRLINNKIFFRNNNSIKLCRFKIISNNVVNKDCSGKLYLYADNVSQNVIKNYTSNDIGLTSYSCVIGNVSKYSMSSSTPTGTTIANNVVNSYLSIDSLEG